ncbi:hypothetical protein ABH922_005711 [Rhodococcus sp. 27YEA15]
MRRRRSRGDGGELGSQSASSPVPRGKPGIGLHTLLMYHGGIAPAPHKARPDQLTPVEREEISRAMVSGDSVRSMTSALGRAPPTISWEISRNGGRYAYRAAAAQDVQVHRPDDPNHACCNDAQYCVRRWYRYSKTSGRRSRSSGTSDCTTATTSWRSATRRSTDRSTPLGGVSFRRNRASAYEHGDRFERTSGTVLKRNGGRRSSMHARSRIDPPTPRTAA